MKTVIRRKMIREVGFQMYFTPEEKQMLTTLAQRQGISMAAWVRKEIREAAILQDVWPRREATPCP